MKIAMLGLGAYAIALAKILCSKNKVVMWSKFEDEVNMVKSSRENSSVLPNIKLDEDIDITNDLNRAVCLADVIILAVPMFALREVCQSLKGIVTDNQIICMVSKGVEKGTYMFPSQVVLEELVSTKIVMVSGPSFANELALGAQTGLTIASENAEAMEVICSIFSVKNISLDMTEDILGVQICATTKNIYAILLGILNGKKKSESTKASVLAKIINDSRTLLELLGGKRKTAYMYAGLGDLLLTCMSTKSRNFTLGKLIGEGKSLDEALSSMSTKTVEGLNSFESIYELLKLTGNIDKVKSITLLYNILNNNVDVDNELSYITN